MTHAEHQATQLTPLITVADNIWIAEGACTNFYGLPYPTRSVIIRLESGKLWVWSPIAFDQDLARSIDALGDVAYLVSPNKIHHLFLSDWKSAYPGAKLCGPASTIEKRADLTFELTLNDEVPSDWQTDLDLVWFNCSLLMDEVVFFHRASRTVIMADLSENFSESFLKAHWKNWQRIGARFWGITEGKGYAPLDWRGSFLNRKATRALRDRVLAWNPERVIMAHGEWQASGGRRFLERSFAWM